MNMHHVLSYKNVTWHLKTNQNTWELDFWDKDMLELEISDKSFSLTGLKLALFSKIYI